MSKVTRRWIYNNVREFNMPFVKRTYLTNKQNLGELGWSSWVADHVDEILDTGENGS